MAAVVTGTFLAGQKSGIPVSATDIINGLIPAPADTNYVRSFEGGPIDNLTDGKTAAVAGALNEFSAQQNAVFSLDGGIPAAQQHGAFWFATYRLPLGAAPAGYDISQIDSVTGHQDTRSNQTIDIEVQFVGDDNFYSLSNNANFAYRPSATGGDGAGRLRLTDDTGGPLARGVRAIRFEADQEAVFRELDVIGTASPVPTTPPATPTDLAFTLQGSDVRLTFTDQATNEAAFRIERAPLVGGVPGTFALLAQLGANNTPPPSGVGGQIAYTDKTTQAGQSYQYRVTAFNAFNGGTTTPPVTVNVTTPTSGQGAAARYFSATRWRGTPVVTQIDPDLSDNAFGTGSPHPLVPADQFSAIYSFRLTPTVTGTYFINVNANDEGYVYIGGGDLDGQFFFADHQSGPGAPTLTAGQTYNVAYLATENAGPATFNLTWNLPGAATATPIPANLMNSTLLPVTAAPTGVTVGTRTATSVEIAFTDNSINEVKYQLERAPVTGGVVSGAYSVVAEDLPNVASLIDQTANPNTTYSYRVRSFNFEGSAVSAPIQATTTARTPLNGATGAWYDSSFWGLAGRPATQNDLAVGSNVDYREEVTEIGFLNPSLDRPGIGITEGGANGQGNYSNAFTGKIVAPEDGVYRILGFGDDDTHVFVNGLLTSYDPGGHGTPANTAAGIQQINIRNPITLVGGQAYNFVLLHAEGVSGSEAILRWITPTMFAATGETVADLIPQTNLRNISDLPVAPGQAGPDTATATTATLTIQDNSLSELRYKVEQSRVADFSSIEREITAPINASNIVVTGLTAGTTYYFRIRGTNLEGEGPEIVTQVTTAGAPVPPAAPTNLTVRTPNARNFFLSWTDNSPAESNFIVRRRVNNTGSFETIGTVNANVTTFQDQIFPAPPVGTPVTYEVFARNAEGDSTPVQTTVLSGAPGGTGLNATAYANTTFTDDPGNPNDTVTYVDPEIGENWSLGPPVAGIPEDNHSVTWSGQLMAEKSETYTFQLEGDNDAAGSQAELIITDAGGAALVTLPLAASAAARNSAPVALQAGQRYNISLRYSDTGGGSQLFLRWSSPTTPIEVIPQSFLFTGPATNVPITEVYVRGSTWAGNDNNPANTTFMEYLEAKGLGDDVLGYRLFTNGAATSPAGNPDNVLPWINMNQIVVRYASAPTGSGVPTPGTLTVNGQRNGAYTVTSVAPVPGDPTAFVLTLAKPLGGGDPVANTTPTTSENGDRVTLAVPGAGTGGANFSFRMNVLQGDVDHLNETVHNVLARDYAEVKKRFFKNSNQAPSNPDTDYSPYHDVDGSGQILATDYARVKSRFFQALPAVAAAGPELFSASRIAEEVLA